MVAHRRETEHLIGRAVTPLLYIGLAVAVAGGLLRRGLVLLVDLSQVPHPHLPAAYWGVPEGTHEGSPSRLPLDALFVALGRVGAVEAGEKLLLLAIVFLAGWGMHRLVTAGEPARFFAGVLYAVNPFVYDRLNAGQWFLLLGYSLIPHGYRAFLRSMDGERKAPWTFAWLTLATAIASSHMFVLLVVLCGMTAAVGIATSRRRVVPARRAALALVLAALPSLYWLIPTPGLEGFFHHIGRSQLALYGTVGDPTWGRVASVLGLFGFWNDPDPIKAHLVVWPLLAAAVLGLALWGLALHVRDRTSWAVALTAILALFLAQGENGITGSLFVRAFEHISLLRAFREPEKWVALIAFGYAYLGASAVDDLVAVPPARSRRLVAALAAVVIALPLVYGYRTFWGLWGTLRPSTFPPSWNAAESVLRREARGSQTLFLPWHGYLALGFAHHRLVANPAPQFFTTPILASRSVGEGAALADNSDPLQRYVERLLATGGHRTDLAACLAQIGVSHVVVAREADFRRYTFLRHQRDLVLEHRWRDLLLYRNTVPTALAMVLRAEPRPRPCRLPTGLRPVGSRREDPAHVALVRPAPPHSIVVLAMPFREAWSLGPANSSPYLDAVNAFRSPGRHTMIELTDWRAYRRNYELGAAGALVVAVSGVAVFTVDRRRRGSPPVGRRFRG